MNRDNDRQTSIILAVLGILPIVWLGLLIAPSVKGGLPEILPSLMNVMSDPFHIVLCEDSVKTVLVLLLCYGMGIGIYFSTRRNYRRREEHGSAKWGNAKAVDKKYRQNPPSENKLMTQAVRIGLNGKKHRRNLNTLVCGGSGAGKTRFYCKPNLMQANTSFVILDPKGEIVRDVGNLLEKKGYEIRVLDLISMEKSHCYNPFVYLHSDNDVQRLVTNLFKSTTPKGSQSNDPFWDTSASMLLSALVYYLHYEAPEDEQNFAMVMFRSKKQEIEDKAEELMELVGIDERLRRAYPHELDGGRRQRVGIARALALNPDFIVCDEPVSALDVSIQAQVLNLLKKLQQDRGLTYMFVTHDMSVVRHISDDICVMYLGQVVEKCPSKELFKNPMHPYTKALLSAIPSVDIHHPTKREVLKGEITSPINPKPGCRFAARCPFATEACHQPQKQEEVSKGHFVTCCRIHEL